MRLRFGLAAIILFTCHNSVGCDPASDERGLRPGGGDRVEVRLRNESAIDFDRVVVQFPSQTEDYGAVASGEASDYRAVEMAYGYAYVEAHGRGGKYVLQPFDYVGEKLLRRGRYSYVLDLVNDELTLELVEHGARSPHR